MPSGSWIDKHHNVLLNLSNVCVILLCILGCVVVARNWIGTHRPRPGIRVVRPAAGFTPPIDFSKFRHTVLVATSSQCAPCKADIPDYQALERSAQNDFRVVYVTSDDQKSSQEFFRRNGLTSLVLFSQRFAQYGLSEAPALQVVNQQGVILYWFDGHLNPERKELLYATLRSAR
jgi:thiol-disulfide isomerase/thioredoxin